MNILSIHKNVLFNSENEKKYLRFQGQRMLNARDKIHYLESQKI